MKAHLIRMTALCALLSACGSGSPIAGAMAGLSGNQGVDLNRVPREKIEAFNTPILRATFPSLGQDLLLSIRDTNGGVETWEAAEGITLTFRDGVLIETRGLGADLMSSSGPSGGQIAAGTGHERNYWYASDEDRNDRRTYACTTATVGAETITLYGREHQTRHVTETCLRDGGKITNEYWFEGSRLRQSKQWVSPLTSYAVFSRVVD